MVPDADATTGNCWAPWRGSCRAARTRRTCAAARRRRAPPAAPKQQKPPGRRRRGVARRASPSGLVASLVPLLDGLGAAAAVAYRLNLDLPPAARSEDADATPEALERRRQDRFKLHMLLAFAAIPRDMPEETVEVAGIKPASKRKKKSGASKKEDEDAAVVAEKLARRWRRSR